MYCKRLLERDRQINEIVLCYLCGVLEIGVIRNFDGKICYVVIFDVQGLGIVGSLYYN